jgi:uncharacterized membrane protein YtjA (UPF0391 family)
MLYWAAFVFIVGIIAAALGIGALAAAAGGVAKALFILGSAARHGRRPGCSPAPL